jgi:hypothetical protein
MSARALERADALADATERALKLVTGGNEGEGDDAEEEGGGAEEAVEGEELEGWEMTEPPAASTSSLELMIRVPGAEDDDDALEHGLLAEIAAIRSMAPEPANAASFSDTPMVSPVGSPSSRSGGGDDPFSAFGGRAAADSSDADSSPSTAPPPSALNPAARASETYLLPVEGLGLSAREVSSLTDKLARLDERLRKLPTHRFEFTRAVKTTATRPLGALNSSSLETLRADFAADATAFRALTQRALAMGSKGLAWERGSGVAANGLDEGGPLWNAWSDSLFEHVVRRGDALLERLERITRELSWVVDTVRGGAVGDGGEAFVPLEGSRAGGGGGGGGGIASDRWEDVSASVPGGGTWRKRPSNPPDVVVLDETRRAHVARLDAELASLLELVRAVNANAAADLPKLEKNVAAARAGLASEATA